MGEEFRRFLDGRAWTHAEGPAALFEQAVGWLRRHRVLLPGVTVLTRLVNTVRDAAADRLHARLAAAPRRVEEIIGPGGGARRCVSQRSHRPWDHPTLPSFA